MKTRSLGSLQVSEVGLGCNNFGMRCDLAQTQLVVDAALDSGINFFDTADIYGGTNSEVFLGQALGKRRADILIATKFGIKIDDDRPGGARPEYIFKACDDSLQRLGTDYIDLYQIHRPDETVPIAETMGALRELVIQGKVRELGCSNFSVAQLRAAAESIGPQFVSVQNEYSLFARQPETDSVLAECAATHVGLLPYFPLASGMLTGKYRKGQPLPEGTRINAESRWLTDENLTKAEALLAFSEAHGHTLLELAFSWLLARSAVSSVIAGATKPEQVRANVAAASWPLTDDELAQIDALLA
ncbi:aldo/keto reductase [Armatimonas rosea]|uniref:Aryl-alcohol dehydrogenase-like predicted oxidoreductase n=1 Tax=Armatimonas rosea TaxID=685828 RepID=A0A7W9SSL8_ARMRO|nr:aldo/keto reductase [Armatimonas rosea]MBB6052102.1 aryl-alcohol dehydrogenase-like predicted oxidoreductase [Armatimonas rosea]